MTSQPLTPRTRVQTALSHHTPDRVPVDFLATPEVWEKMVAALEIKAGPEAIADFMQPEREALLRRLEIDCRVLSYDMFYNPPQHVYHPGAQVDWWGSLNRSTPNRMWRQALPDGTIYDLWGLHSRKVANAFGAYEEIFENPLAAAQSLDDLKAYAWPDPDWWDFSPLPDLIAALDTAEQTHLRFRIGSVFEIAWQLRGMDTFMLDLAMQPEMAAYIMERLTEIHVENTRRVLELVGERLDMVYFYDDVASQDGLLISPKMWQTFIRPRHAALIDLAHAYNKPVMYHCDGALYRLLPELIELGIAVFNPVQPDAKGMQPARLKAEFGDRLAFHGGMDIIHTLPKGTPQEVAAEVRRRIQELGTDGGYILCSSHHIQADTPVENVLAMYALDLRNPN